MAAEGKGLTEASNEKIDASAVIENAITAMRQHLEAKSAADAIERACEGRKFDVDLAVAGIKPPEPSTEETA